MQPSFCAAAHLLLVKETLFSQAQEVHFREAHHGREVFFGACNRENSAETLQADEGVTD